MDKMERLSNTVQDMAMGGGAVAAGIVTTETLAGGPPSTDLSYILPQAKSAVVFAMPLDQEAIESFLKKEDMGGANIDNHRVNSLASGVALEIAEYLNMKGFESAPVIANTVYRKDVPGGPHSKMPPLSHRYLAVRAGVGHFGMSGNVIMDKYGAAIIFGTAVTTAELLPTDALNPEDNYCDECKLCMSACASGLMSPDETAEVSIGGKDFNYATRRSYSRCDYVCVGFTGLHQSGKWSTWSPARFPIPENDEEFLPALMETVDAYRNRPRQDFGCNIYNHLVPGNRFDLTCGHCQFVCHPDKEVRKNRFQMITNGGVVIQLEDGSLKAVSPDEAKSYLAAMDDKTRSMYE